MNLFLGVALLLLGGLVLGRSILRAGLPPVLGFILAGVLLGRTGLGLITPEMLASLGFINHLALAVLAMSIGQELHRQILLNQGASLAFLTLVGAGITFTLTSGAAILLGWELELAIVLGVISLSVSPAGVMSVIKERGAKGPFSRFLMAMVALENIICVLAFTGLTTVLVGLRKAAEWESGIVMPLVRIIGLTGVLGILGGLILAWGIDRPMGRSRLVVLVLGIVFLLSGLALRLELPILLINMLAGAVAANLTDTRLAFDSVLEDLEGPVLVLFMTLAGAKLNLEVLPRSGFAGIAYIFARLAGKLSGAYIGTALTRLPAKYKGNLGLALTPQAGIALGLSIIAEQKLPEAAGRIAIVVLAGVLFFELLGPVLVAKALKRTGEG